MSAVATAALIFYYKKWRYNKVDKMSFREAMNLTGLPVVTFRQGDVKLNFVLDTGASGSLIDSRVLNHIKYVDIVETRTGGGYEGKLEELKNVGIEFTYKNTLYADIFSIKDLSELFDRIKRKDGVTLHGILSSEFFETYKYVLDFAELVAYPKLK